ncbi:MAG TPA: alpha/beta fold hydrolase [Alphaproteobacteria bacterium]|nr:alpha/beta fold hydrolase [Alphaproteobacteria bacterium]
MTEHDLKQIDAGKLTIGYRESGSGEAVIFLHGIGSGSAGWASQLDHFGAHWRAIAWDAPGYGGSGDFAEETPGTAAYADALAAFLDAIGIESAHLVGNSLGSLFAGAFAGRHRGRVRSLMLSDPAIGHGEADPETREKSLKMRLDGVYNDGPAKMAEARAINLVGPGTGEDVLEAVRGVMRQVRPDGYAQAARTLSQGNLLKDLEGCDAPALVATGSEDIVTPPEGGRRVADALVNGRFVLLDGLGHLPYVEAPERFNALLGDFLADQERAAA